MYFCVNEFEAGVNDNIFSGNEQQKVYISAQIIVKKTSFKRLRVVDLWQYPSNRAVPCLLSDKTSITLPCSVLCPIR